MIKEKHIVSKQDDAIRITDYLIGVFELCPTKSSIKKAIKQKQVKVNGKDTQTGYWIKKGDVITFETDYSIYKPLELDLPIIFEDEYFAVIHKPAGISVSGNLFYTIENALSYNLKESNQSDAIRPQPTHRLDNQTSGLLIIAKTKKARIRLGEMFENKSIQKIYHALVIGDIKISGEIDTIVDKKSASTLFEKVKSIPSLKNKHLSLVKLFPKTGRTHQLRIHLSSIGFPILGDKLYGQEGMILKNKGLFLCSTGLLFIHPILGNIVDISIPVPYKFLKRMENEERRFIEFQSAHPKI